MRWAVAALVVLLAVGTAFAEDSLRVCYNYGCAVEEIIILSDNRIAWVREMLAAGRTPETEREMLALVIGQLYAWAGEQTPIWRDRGGNHEDGELDGRMDCIDHATTTTRFLTMIAEHGWLRFHRVPPPERRLRFFFAQHFSAVIEELGPVRDPNHPLPERYVVDSWFRNNGEPAVILPLEDWLNGEDADVK